MDRFARIITFQSAHFPRNAVDNELTNHENMYGYALSKFIGDELEKRGQEVDYLVEDWGWYCFIVSSEPTLAYGVTAENHTNDFIIQFIPDKPYVRKLFRKIDISKPLARLQDDVFAILQAAPSSSGPVWSEG